MDHPYEDRAHYNSHGKVCHCPWGHGKHNQERYGSVKEASKFDWLSGREDMQKPEGKEFLRYLDREGYRSADKLLPWLTREWKKGRVNIPHNWEEHVEKPLTYGERPQNNHEHNFSSWDAEQAQNSLEEMSKRRMGVDVMQHKIHELMPKVQDHQDWKDSIGREGMGETLHSYPDGWSVRLLGTPEEYADEGQRMGHCIGDQDGDNQYSEAGAQEMAYHVSLRDHKNMPHATMELRPSAAGGPIPDSYISEFYGKQDASPLPEYEDRMRQWLEPHGVPFEWEGNPEAELWHEENGGQPILASHTRPLYYRWVYSPSKGVTVNSNQETHPALIKYHSDLGGDINDTDLSHGYASSIGNGWRITDLAHQPVDDPYIVQQVVRRLNLEDGPQKRSEGAWQPSEYNWERLHYGLPCELSGQQFSD